MGSPLFPVVPRTVWHESFVVAPLQDQACGALFESVVLLHVEESAIRGALLGQCEEVAGQDLQPGGVGLNDDLSARVADLDACGLPQDCTAVA